MASSSQETATAAPDPSLVLFARGVIARLTIWPALRLAVDEAWGGPDSAQKRTWIVSVIVDAFDPAESQENPDEYYVEDMLLQMMADEFDTVLEDGSAEAVAKDIMKLWANISIPVGVQLIDEWEAQVQKMKGKKIASQKVVDETIETDGESGSSDGEDEDDDMEGDEAPRLVERREPKEREEPEVDEDGFILVKGKGKGNRAG